MSDTPPKPVHIAGTARGEKAISKKGKEPGRGTSPPYRTARDSTSINPEAQGPIDPRMPHLPPA
jgi:hypothetical protein